MSGWPDPGHGMTPIYIRSVGGDTRTLDFRVLSEAAQFIKRRKIVESRVNAQDGTSRRSVSRREILRYLLLGGVGVVGSACSGPSPAQAPTPAAKAAGQPTAGPSGAAQPAAQPTKAPVPKRGGTLKVAQGVDVLNFDPTAVGAGNSAFLHELYDTLIEPFPGGKQGLAESWKITDGGLTLTFSLRRGAKFHTGREIVADDVKFSLDRYKDPTRVLRLGSERVALRAVE